ncbi:hypothetical protein [Vallitalea sp.]|jgi:hypothetical protein|uniref:hypothetical protein n=1 Tax=Vallitalea sp. TaxID=1882829 RepID=UPI0025EA4E69|nr:hypothetical protein [Vallitalea sp.]MCT4687435.1 hypothetical protein [Vallitalea sp.]
MKGFNKIFILIGMTLLAFSYSNMTINAINVEEKNDYGQYIEIAIKEYCDFAFTYSHIIVIKDNEKSKSWLYSHDPVTVEWVNPDGIVGPERDFIKIYRG